MKLVPQSAPYIRKNVSVGRMMMDVIIALSPVVIFALIQNGWKATSVVLTSVLTMVFFELLAHMFIKWPKDMKFKELFTSAGFKKVYETYTINNILAPVISGLIYAMIMPAGCSWYVVFTGAVFGIIIGKMVFGGLGSNIFNPAAVGRIFVAICFGSKLGEAYKAQTAYNVTVGATPLGVVKGNIGNLGGYSLLDAFIGNVPGCMGEVSVICILVGAIYLFIRRSADLRAALGYLLSFAALMLVASISYVGKFGTGNVGEIWLYQLFTGGVMFAAVYMITDPVTSPTSKFGRVLHGAIAGSITVLIRLSGAYPEGAAFSILIANAIAPAIDYLMRGKRNTYTWKQCLGLGIAMVVMAAIVSACVMGGWF